MSFMIQRFALRRFFRGGFFCAIGFALLMPLNRAGPKRFVVTAFGAVADGKTLNTVAIQKAIDGAAATVGGC